MKSTHKRDLHLLLFDDSTSVYSRYGSDRVQLQIVDFSDEECPSLTQLGKKLKGIKEGDVVIIDSINALLERNSPSNVFKLLRETPTAPIIFRFNTGLVSLQEKNYIKSQLQTVVEVETHCSRSQYPILKQKALPIIPKHADGVALIIRKNTTGKVKQYQEYFLLKFRGQDELPSWNNTDIENAENPGQAADVIASISDDIGFNLQVTNEEERMREQVTLPFHHQGNMLYIDPDDPDWDDDEIDDDLDL